MNLRISGFFVIAVFATGLLGSQSLAQNAYITNQGSNSVSVIDTATNTVSTTISGTTLSDLAGPSGVAVSPDGRTVYVTNCCFHSVSVIDTATNTVITSIPLPLTSYPAALAVSPDGRTLYVVDSPVATCCGTNRVFVIDTAMNTVSAAITVGFSPVGVAVSPDGRTVYVANTGIYNGAIGNPGVGVSVIDTATNTVSTIITVGGDAWGVAVSPDGRTVYVTNAATNNVSVIDTATNTVSTTINVGAEPFGVAVSPDGRTVYVANDSSNNVSVIDTATNTVSTTINVGSYPVAFGLFIQPAPNFAGTPGQANCHGQSVSALARQYGGLNNAAAALGFPSVPALQQAIMAFCEG